MVNRRILLIAPRFFGYEQDIVDELRVRGAEVDFLPDRPFDSSVMKAATRFARPFVIGAADRFYSRELNRLGRSSYDIIFVVNGQTLSNSLLGELRKSFPGAKFLLYMWDSFKNRRSAAANLRFFDECFSFDQDCSKEYALKFRPLFFAPGFERGNEGAFDYHLSFVGTCHTDRYAIISKLAFSLGPDVRFYRYLYLQARWVYIAYRLINSGFRSARKDHFYFKTLPRETVQEVFFRSRAVLDIEHPNQKGLTIRTLETLGSSRKLITTNSRVREYDFFQPENICVIDRRSPAIPAGFLETPFQEPDIAIKAKYGIKGWIDDVVGNKGSTFLKTPEREQRTASGS